MEPTGDAKLDVVTGAFGYTGKYIARRLLAQGRRVKTLTGHPDRPNPFGQDRVEAVPFNFDKPDELRESLRGVSTLYNTYWVRFSHGPVTFERAVQNTKTLIEAASAAGVGRFIHVSITNPSLDSSLPYFSGKAQLEQALAESGLSYAIVRPTVIFGIEDILVNNMAWLLRHFPIFASPGRGDYRLQPIYVEDMARLVVDVAQREENVTLDAVGPDIFTFDEMVRLIAEKVGSKARIVHVSPSVAL
ncbi:MAG: NAD(P)H-binding protein, partial [Chloroflexi bacterium]|nr:NAD(P)H-binding protein [Chloroflexota bacterium]